MAGHVLTQNVGTPFSSFLLQLLFNITEAVLRPLFVCINGIFGPFLAITTEKQNTLNLWRSRILVSPLYLLLMLMIAFPALIATFVKNVLHRFRETYCLSICNSGTTADRSSRKNKKGPTTCTVATANLCLLPEIMARYNNLNNTKQRTNDIGQRILTDQMHYGGMTKKYAQPNAESNFKTSSTNMPLEQKFKVNIITHFPQTDILCLQETFDRDCAKRLLSELHKVYPWIVYDADHSPLDKKFCGLSSGLMIASRYKFTALRFKPFTDHCGFCTITNKGLLMAKVNLNSQTSDGKPKVGYIFNTHLQAFQGTKPIVQSQMSEILQWTDDFRHDTGEEDEYVAFDVLAGDFNVDNMSPGEAAISRHELFSEYIDVGRVRSGLDHDWTVGTECRNELLHEPEVSDPEGLKDCLEDPYLRQRFILDANLKTATIESIYKPSVIKDEHGNIELSPVGGKRRIDLVLYRKDTPVAVQNYNFVTRLARLTDHIPVSLTFTSLK